MQDKPNLSDRVILGLLAVLVVFPALAMGGVAPWARCTLLCLAVLLLAVWLVKSALDGRATILRHPTWLFILGFFVVVALQLVPLSPGVLEALQPETHASYALTLPEYPEANEARPLSLIPYHTGREIQRLAVLALVFFVAVHTVRTRRQILFLVATLIFLGAFESLYGFYEHFSGRKHIFWQSHPHASEAVTGTFLNKNHYAGLLEMIAPLALCLFLASGSVRLPGAGRSRKIKQFAVHLSILVTSSGFAVRITAILLAMAMVLAVVFSLSRAGIACLAAALVGLVLFALSTAGFRRYALVVVGIGLLIVAVASSIGISTVIDGVEDAASGQSAQWLDRLDLSRTSMACIRDFPLLGAGLGTFGDVFPRYQSGRFGDRWANFLHNDWLQLFCETGVLGATLVILGLAWFLASTIRNIRQRKGVFSRWIAVGGLVGIGAMVIHSFFDYNLSRITSNGIVFAVVLAVTYRASILREDGSVDGESARFLNLSVASAPARIAMGSLALACMAAAAVGVYGPLKADVQFNRYLTAGPSAGKSEDYFFLPASPSCSGARPDLLARAHASEPDNPEFSYHLALNALEDAGRLVRHRALENARRLVGFSGAGNSDDVDALAASLEYNLKGAMREERRLHLEKARRHLCRAISLAPTRAAYHAELGRVLQELEGRSGAGLRAVKTALRLSPNKPDILYRCGLFFLGRRMSSSGEAEAAGKDLGVIRDCFRKSIQGDPAYAKKILPVVAATLGDTQALVDVTPRTLPGYGNLLIALWNAGDWSRYLPCLDAVDEMAAGKPAVKLDAAQKRCTVLSILGRWEELAAAVKEYRRRLRLGLEPEVEEARRLRRCGRHSESMKMLTRILDRDWGHPRARLEAAEIASLPRIRNDVPAWNSPLDHIFRLVVHTDSWSTPVFERAMKVVRMEEPGNPGDARRIAFLRGAGQIRSGNTAAGVKTLLEVEEANGTVNRSGALDTLVWYWLGQGCEELGRVRDAVGYYRRVVEEIPNHRDALVRLVDLGEDDLRSRLDALTPAVPCRMDFGGRVSLLGYDLIKIPAASRPGWTLTTYWMFTERLDPIYRPSVHFLDGFWNLIFTADHRISALTHSPRPGEVVVRKVRLREDPTRVRFMRVGLLGIEDTSDNPPALHPSWGKRYAPTTVDLKGTPPVSERGAGRP